MGTKENCFKKLTGTTLYLALINNDLPDNTILVKEEAPADKVRTEFRLYIYHKFLGGHLFNY